ncbi:DUF6255 family natural product biosynthesis protein [Streptomyces stramineus]|uniref:DUF6255 family natural product biosynthesis protein n=1 Tax=Streptomyces TaxID=1883 RepID=UPI0031E35657
MTVRWLGRLVRHCAHPAGWRSHGAHATCAAGCGTRRFTGYAALLPDPGEEPTLLATADNWWGRRR